MSDGEWDDDAFVRMPAARPPIGDIPFDLTRPPPVTYLVDPVAVEEGRSRERVAWEVVKPGSNKDTADTIKWQSGKFVKDPNSKTEFQYSFEMGPHLLHCLSAKKVGEKFYISQYKDFPRSCDAYLNKEDDDNFCEVEPPNHYIAVLEPDYRQVATYKLCLTAQVTDPKATPTLAKDIATIQQSTFKIKEATSAPIRAMSISIPPLVQLAAPAKDEDEEDEPDYLICQGMNEDMWARYPTTPLLPQTDLWAHHVKPKYNPRKKEKDLYRAKKVKMSNKTPFWNYDVGSLVVKFDRNRVTMASSKNFVIYHDRDVNDHEKMPSDAILQFGKVGKKTFTLDYKMPLCALQAFGIALSAFAWKGDHKAFKGQFRVSQPPPSDEWEYSNYRSRTMF
mmetsp:Transcript_14774/g.30409  ORF Transcript_14774/g.30409 Transcript_14774/m.30409 type:complete len:392 (+) Transcript_14774:36-1211(+)